MTNIDFELINNDFEKEAHKIAKKILQNLEFEASEVCKDKEGASVLLTDKNSGLELWFDIWQDAEDYNCDWNMYIFSLENSLDLIKKYIQEDINAFEQASEVAIEAIENEL